MVWRTRAGPHSAHAGHAASRCGSTRGLRGASPRTVAAAAPPAVAGARPPWHEPAVVAQARIVETAVDGFAARTLMSPNGILEATFVVDAGMVGCSLRHQGAELLDPRRGVARYASAGATMGILLLHPWANRLEGFRYAVRSEERRVGQ